MNSANAIANVTRGEHAPSRVAFGALAEGMAGRPDDPHPPTGAAHRNAQLGTRARAEGTGQDSSAMDAARAPHPTREGACAPLMPASPAGRVRVGSEHAFDSPP